jgi:hypothetical protein
MELKKQAQEDIKNNIIIQQFDNQQQRSMYAQWNRIYVNNKLYRGWTSKDENNKTFIFQYMVPQQQRDEILRLAHDTELSGH